MNSCPFALARGTNDNPATDKQTRSQGRVFFDRVILDLKVRGFWYSSYLHLTSLAEESLGWDDKEGARGKEAIPGTLPSTTYGRKIERRKIEHEHFPAFDLSAGGEKMHFEDQPDSIG
jgi:hypothetical protein